MFVQYMPYLFKKIFIFFIFYAGKKSETEKIYTT